MRACACSMTACYTLTACIHMHIEATSSVVSATEVVPGASWSPTAGTPSPRSQSVVVEQISPPTSVTIGSARSVTLPAHVDEIDHGLGVTLPLHYRYITVTLPLHYLLMLTR